MSTYIKNVLAAVVKTSVTGNGQLLQPGMLDQSANALMRQLHHNDRSTSPRVVLESQNSASNKRTSSPMAGQSRNPRFNLNMAPSRNLPYLQPQQEASQSYRLQNMFAPKAMTDHIQGNF